jgi:hypothetical protein
MATPAARYATMTLIDPDISEIEMASQVATLTRTYGYFGLGEMASVKQYIIAPSVIQELI